MAKLKALVVGLGKIGMGYDSSLDPQNYVLTHTRAFAEHPLFSLVGGVDANLSNHALFHQKYKAPVFSNLIVALKETKPDVIAIAVPTEYHKEVLKAVLQDAKPKAILCEKPLSYKLEEAQRMIDLCSEQRCRLYVNYMRRSDPGVIEVKRRLDEQIIEYPIKGVTWYSKGLFHNGSHFFNLLEYWLGCMEAFKIISPGRLWNDIDPEPDIQVSFAHGTVIFLAAHEEKFSHYTVELIASNGRLRYEHGGEKIIWQQAADGLIQGYRKLTPTEELIPADLNRSQWNVANQLANSLNGLDAHICSGNEALQTLQSLSEIRNGL